MAAMQKPRSFLGTGWCFPPQFGRSGGTVMVSNEEDIRESLLILLSTRPGERVMHPTYGCGLQTLVFENISESLKTKVKEMVARAIAQFETRVSVELINVLTDALGDALLKIEIGYRVNATNSVHNMVFPFYIDNGLDLYE